MIAIATPARPHPTGQRRARRKPRRAGTVCQQPGKRCPRKVLRSYEGRNYCAVHLADRLVGDRVKARDQTCVRCGSLGPLDWAHVIGRSYWAVRWSWGERITDSHNDSVALCRPCHAWQTYNPLEGEEFFRSRGLDYDNLKYLALHDPPADPEQVVVSFLGEAV